jgi:periodic tryptophan protein 1
MNEDEFAQPEEPVAAPSDTRDAMNEDDIVAKYNLEDYDEEPDNLNWGSSEKHLMYHQNNEEDPYITAPDVDNEELEDFMIRPTDDVVLCAVMEEDGWSHLDVCILPDNKDAELYVHHDYQLPAFPLCVAWVPPNVAAVGTFNPDIELWDLNIVDSAEPDGKLQGHTDAVLGLAAHPFHSQMLASASADTTVRLWDISTQQEVLSLNHHKTKVQSLAWSPANSAVEYQGLLASGGFDQRTFVLDVRQPDSIVTIELEADVESLRWLTLHDGAAPTLFISTESGELICYDIVAGKRKWTLSAHAGTPCSSFSLYQYPEGGPTLLATSTPDAQAPLKLWTIEEGRGPSCIYQKTSDFGRLYSVAFAPERPFHLAVGGHDRTAQVFNCLQLAEVQRVFGQLPGIVLPNSQPSLSALKSFDRDGDSDEDADDQPQQSYAAPQQKRSITANKYQQRPPIGASKKKKH